MTHDHSNHMWTMALACGGALLLILVLPLIGLSQSWAVGIAIVVMVIMHLWMMKGHLTTNHKGHKRGSKDEKN